MELPLSNGDQGLGLSCLTDPVTESNCYVIRQDRTCLVIDPNSFRLLELLFQKWNIRPCLALLTHEHCDHIGGLNELRERYHIPVAASRECSRGIQSAKENMSRMMEMFLYYKNGETKITPYKPFTCRETEIQFEGELYLPLFGGLISMKNLPGHTRGSSVISYEIPSGNNGSETIVFCGDYLLPGEQVLTRLPGGSMEDYEKIAKPWLVQIPDGIRIFPGHGNAFRMSREVRNDHDL